MKITNKKYLLFIICTAVAFLSIGFFVGKRYKESGCQDLDKLGLAQMKVLKSNQVVINSLNAQYRSCIAAYNELRACISNKSCDIQKSEEKLQMLEELRASAEATINVENEKILQVGRELK